MKKPYFVSKLIHKIKKRFDKESSFQENETAQTAFRAALNALHGKYKGHGLMKAFLAGKKQEKEL